jgi:hypothetical protein
MARQLRRYVGAVGLESFPTGSVGRLVERLRRCEPWQVYLGRWLGFGLMLSSLKDIFWIFGVLLNVIPALYYKRYLAVVDIVLNLSLMVIGFLFLTARPRKGRIFGGLVIANIVFVYGWLMLLSLLGG